MSLSLLQGNDFFAKEQARLDRMVSSGSVAAKKVDDMLKKSSVLGAFVPEEEEPADS